MKRLLSSLPAINFILPSCNFFKTACIEYIQ